MDRTDAYLERKARAVWERAECWEDTLGRFWLKRVPASTPVLLSDNVATVDHPRRSFIAARVRLAVLLKRARVAP